jgi:transcriptional regulator with XRE-family HTH domain
MTSSDLKTDTSPEAQAVRLGHTLRARRKMLGISVVAAAEAAGISRVTWHRLEKGEMTVAWGSVLAAADVLGMRLSLDEAAAAGRVGERPPNLENWLPLTIRLDDYPGLRSLAWQIREGLDSLDPRGAWEIYERNWRHLDPSELSKGEQALIHALRRTFDRAFHDV